MAIARGIKDASDPVIRTTSSAPLAQDFARKQVSKQQRSNFHSTSLSPLLANTMVSLAVNKTNLHPGGLQYVTSLARAIWFQMRITTNEPTRPAKEHTEIEEELHDKAHIDYDRVAIVSCSAWHHKLHTDLHFSGRQPFSCRSL
jgi:phosphoenolpyruvate carboxykinase (ATP)